MSQSIFEIRQVFNVSRQEIGKADEGQFSIANAVKELGKDQLIDNINHMLGKEAGKGFKGGINLQYNPVDYLSENYEGKITPELREEGVLSILQFAVQTNCLDQTVLQAVHLGDNYLRFNQSCSPAFIRLIYAMSLEISIKMNEQTILSLEDIESLFENRFNQNMLINLERHILSLNNFRVNMATPLDYVLNFAYLEEELLTSQSINGESITLQPDQLVNDTIYLLHYAMSQYGLSRKKYSSLAVASMCLVLQDAHDDLQQEQTASGLSGNAQVFESASNSDCCSPMQELRDAFLASILHRFPQLDLDEVYEILREFKVPFIQLAQNMTDGQNEYSTNNMEMVSEPWTFDRLFKNDNINVCEYMRNGDTDDMDMEQTAQLQMSYSPVPHKEDMIPSLNLGKKDESSSNFQQIRRIETEGDLIISTAETSIQGTTHRDYYKSNNMLPCGGSGQKAPMLGLLDRDDEELKSANGGNQSHRFERNESNRMIISPEPAPHELGRPSLSESNGSHSRTFRQGVGNNENLFDDNLEIDDEEEQQQQKMHLHQTSGSRLNQAGSGSLMQQINATGATDGPFQVIRQDVDEPFDEYDADNDVPTPFDTEGDTGAEALVYSSRDHQNSNTTAASNQ